MCGMQREPPTITTSVAPAPEALSRRKRIIIASTIAATFLFASFGGIALYLTRDNGPSTFVEIYMTDLPADFSRLDVRIGGVYVGAAKVPLELDNFRFNLLAHQGPAEALRIASGPVPQADHQEVTIVFQSARAELDHKRIDVDIPEGALNVRHDFGFNEGGSRALLFDIDVNESLVVSGPMIEFSPFVRSVYIHAYGALGGASNDADDSDPGPSPTRGGNAKFQEESAQEPQRQSVSQPSARWYRAADFSGTPTTSSGAPGTTNPSQDTTDDSTEEDNTTHNDTAQEALPTIGDSASQPKEHADTVFGWFAQYNPNLTSPEALVASLQANGVELVHRFVGEPALYIGATPVEAENLSWEPWIEYIEPDLPVELLLGSSKRAIRLPELLASPTLKDPSGQVLDGRGVGVAIVDSGIDGLHPDLPHRIIEGKAALIQQNLKMTSIVGVDLVYTDTTSGHGTHVAGILAGQGRKEAGQRGVAPGVTVYGLGIGDLSTVLWPNQALDWISVNHDKVTPRIKVVQNSWGTKGAYDPNSLTARLVNQLVAKGMVVVFAAGNGGGDGNAAATTAECQIPTPGVLCVANYNDFDAGRRDGSLGAGSSKGSKANPNTWPDISAPGEAIRSARTPFGWVTGVGLTDYYVVISGTSMAAPHVSGAAALILQARPTLTPAQVHLAIIGSATQYASDPNDPYTANGHYAYGQGLLDVHAAVQLAKTYP